MEKRIASPNFKNDHKARQLMEFLEEIESNNDVGESIFYYEVPVFRDERDKLYRPSVIYLSRKYGVFVIAIPECTDGDDRLNTIKKSDSELVQVDSVLFGKFLKSKYIRVSRREVKVKVYPLLYAPEGIEYFNETESNLITSKKALERNIISDRALDIDDDAWDEVISLIEGGKGINRIQEWDSFDQELLRYSKIIYEIESGITNFDAEQRYAALTLVNGPQRIRGLAGSGKTIVLAMKAAYLHLQKPDAIILFTFWTKSLYDLIKNQITRFYRLFDDRDPDWEKVHIIHAWGGKSLEGVYYNACIDNGQMPFAFKKVPLAHRENGFGYICGMLVNNVGLKQKYDYVLIDEGQDLPLEFYRLCYQITNGDVFDRNIIWAYDDLQTIMDAEIQNVAKTFGYTKEGYPLMDLERAEHTVSEDILPHDIVLHKCYRNPLEVLVTAHALGFGLYTKKPVQMLENCAHWRDLGYEIVKGNCVQGESTVIRRPRENSPTLMNDFGAEQQAISYFVAPSIGDEVSWVVDGIKEFIDGGVKENQIMVISLDDRNTKAYFSRIAQELIENDIRVNNIMTSMFERPKFSIDGHVTLSTVYRAKGNEAFVVYVVGVDALLPVLNTIKVRNRIFTSITRSKGWLRMSGLSQSARILFNEVDEALSKSPNLEFIYPNVKEIGLIQRDLSEKSNKLLELQRVMSDLGIDDSIDTEQLMALLKSKGKK